LFLFLIKKAKDSGTDSHLVKPREAEEGKNKKRKGWNRKYSC